MSSVAVEGESGQLRHALLLMGELYLIGDVELVPERHGATSHEYDWYKGVRQELGSCKCRSIGLPDAICGAGTSYSSGGRAEQ
jgi:hypothetical protein